MFGKNLSVYSSLAEPAVGEVAELVELIRQSIALAWEPAALMLGNMTAAELSRVADLLERLSPPQPVPVTERLPGPEDTDAEGQCWWYGDGEDLITYWLPAHSLPSRYSSHD